MNALYYLLTIFCSYLIGSSNMSYYISRIKKIDFRSGGSKNLGASNTVLLAGWKAGIAVGVHDILKGVLAVIASQIFFSDLPYIGVLAGVSCVLGHIFPFYLKFKGGKGFASYIGVAYAINWKAAMILTVIILTAMFLTDYIVVATTMTVTLVPIVYGFTERNYVIPLILLVASAVIIIKHIENYKRMINKTETRLSNVGKPKDKTEKGTD